MISSSNSQKVSELNPSESIEISDEVLIKQDKEEIKMNKVEEDPDIEEKVK